MEIIIKTNVHLDVVDNVPDMFNKLGSFNKRSGQITPSDFYPTNAFLVTKHFLNEICPKYSPPDNDGFGYNLMDGSEFSKGFENLYLEIHEFKTAYGELYLIEIVDHVVN